MPEGIGSDAVSSASQPQTATIIYGVYNAAMPVVNRTIGQVKRELGGKDEWDVPADAQGYDGKTALADDHVIKAGQTITFSKKLGEKG